MKATAKERIAPIALIALGLAAYSVATTVSRQRRTIEDRALLCGFMFTVQAIVPLIGALVVGWLAGLTLDPLGSGLLKVVGISLAVAGASRSVPMGWVIGFFIVIGLALWLLDADLGPACLLATIHTLTYLALLVVHNGAN